MEPNEVSNQKSIPETTLTTTTTSADQFNEQKLKECIKRHNICGFFSRRLTALKDFKIAFILDDSGSMNEVLGDSPLNHGSYKATRWDELQEFIKISIEIANTVNPTGCDVHFLNRPMASNVNDFEELKAKFHNKPSGFTPITKIFRKVLATHSNSQLLNTNTRPKKMLVVIITDGEPTDLNGKLENVAKFHGVTIKFVMVYFT